MTITRQYNSIIKNAFGPEFEHLNLYPVSERVLIDYQKVNEDVIKNLEGFDYVISEPSL